MLKFWSAPREDENEKIERIYQQYKNDMFYAAKRVLRDECEAEDAVQQSFIKILKNKKILEETNCHNMRAYLVTVSRNTAIDILRLRGEKEVVSFELVETGVGENDVRSDGNLVRIINSLPHNYAQVLLLKFKLGYSNEEISQILEISEENLRQRIHRAKKRLAEMLEKEGYCEGK